MTLSRKPRWRSSLHRRMFDPSPARLRLIIILLSTALSIGFLGLLAYEVFKDGIPPPPAKLPLPLMHNNSTQAWTPPATPVSSPRSHGRDTAGAAGAPGAVGAAGAAGAGRKHSRKGHGVGAGGKGAGKAAKVATGKAAKGKGKRRENPYAAAATASINLSPPPPAPPPPPSPQLSAAVPPLEATAGKRGGKPVRKPRTKKTGRSKPKTVAAPAKTETSS